MSDRPSSSNVHFARLAGAALAVGAILLAGMASQAGAEQSGESATWPDLKDFDSISLTGPDDVIVTIADHFAVRVEGDPTAIERLRIDVRSGTLRVRREQGSGGVWREGDKAATIRVAMPVMRRASLAGSGDMQVERMAGDRVTASISGSGDLRIAQVEAEDMHLSLSGAGDMTVAGRVGTLSLSIAGSGDINAGRLHSATASVSIAGSGDAYVHATESATVSIVGSGDAMVRGTSNCRVSTVGSGDAHCAA